MDKVASKLVVASVVGAFVGEVLQQEERVAALPLEVVEEEMVVSTGVAVVVAHWVDNQVGNQVVLAGILADSLVDRLGVASVVVVDVVKEVEVVA